MYIYPLWIHYERTNCSPDGVGDAAAPALTPRVLGPYTPAGRPLRQEYAPSLIAPMSAIVLVSGAMPERTI